MESALESVIFACVVAAAAVWLVGAVWAVLDALSTPRETFATAERRKWLWIIFAVLLPYVGVYYTCTVRHTVKGSTFAAPVGTLTLALGTLFAAAAAIAVIIYVDAAAVLLAIPIATLVYLGLHKNEWTDSVPTA